MNKEKGEYHYYIVSYDQSLKASEPNFLLTTIGDVRFVEGDDKLIVIEKTDFEMKISKIDADLRLQLIDKVKIDKVSGNDYNLNDLKIIDNQLAFIGVQINNEKETRFDIDFKDLNQNISDYKFSIDGKKLLIKGFMAEDPEKRFLGGIFSFIYNLEDGSLTSRNSQDFDKDFLFQNYDKKTTKNYTKGYERNNYSPLMRYPLIILEDKILEDGSSIILGEYYQLKISTSTSADGSTSTTTTNYHRDLLFFKISANGKILWIKKIKRAITSSSGIYGKVFSHIKDDQLFLVYENLFQINATKIDLSSGANESTVVFPRKEIKKYHSDFRNTHEIKKDNFALKLFRGRKDIWALEISFED